MGIRNALCALLFCIFTACSGPIEVVGVVIGKEEVGQEVHIQPYADATHIYKGSSIVRTRVLACFYAFEIGDTVRGVSMGVVWNNTTGPVNWYCNEESN